jgi:hypothetical protein
MAGEAVDGKIQRIKPFVDTRATAHVAHDTTGKTCDNGMSCVRLDEKNANRCQVKKVTASANNGSSKVLAVTEMGVSADPIKTARMKFGESYAVGRVTVLVLLLRKAACHLSRRLEKVILKSAATQCTATNSGMLGDQCKVYPHRHHGQYHHQNYETGRESCALGAVMAVKGRTIDERAREMGEKEDVPVETTA